MAYSLGFSKLIQYDPGLPGISIPVRIGVSREVSVVVDAKVDTGSTYCIFSREVAESLGLDVESGLAVPIRTATATPSNRAFMVAADESEFGDQKSKCGVRILELNAIRNQTTRRASDDRKRTQNSNIKIPRWSSRT